MFLVEASRGCQWGCRFCAAGFMYRPIRYRAPEMLIAEAERGLAERKRHRPGGRGDGERAGRRRHRVGGRRRGGRLSPSSLKADCISPALASALARGGNHSVTVAPEAGSERMRKVINKNLTEAEILHAAEMMLGEGVGSLKFYFMIGLPEERDEDVLAIADLVGQGPRARPRAPHAHRLRDRLAQSVRAEAVDAVSMGSDGGRASDQAQGRDAAHGASRGWDRSSSMPNRRAKRISRRWSRAAIAASAESSNGSEARDAKAPAPIWHELGEIHREVEAGENSRCPIPISSSLAITPTTNCCRGTLSIITSTNGSCWRSAKKAHHEHQTPPCDVERCTVCGAC